MALSFEQYQKLRSQGLSNDQIRRFESGEKPNKPMQKGILGRAVQSIKETVPNVFNAVKKRISDTQNVLGSELQQGTYSTPKAFLHTAGTVAGSIGDIAGGVAKIGYQTALPETAQETVKAHALDILKTPAGQAGVEALKSGSDIYGKFKESNPDIARSLEDVLNIASIIPIGKGAQFAGKGVIKGGQEVKNIASDIKQGVGILRTPTEEGLNKIIDTSIEKGIRPSVAGKRNFAQIEKYKENARTAVKTIVENKNKIGLTDDNGEIVKGILPQSLKQFSEAQEQTKKAIFKKYNKLAQKAGQGGATIQLSPVANELEKLTSNAVMQDIAPEAVSYASKRAESLLKRGQYTAEQAQEAIKQLNSRLESFYKNPNPGDFSKLQVDALIVNNIRKSLDDTIMNATGKGYQELKNVYGALKSIEKDLNHRAIVDARKNVKGLIDFADIFSAGDIIMGATTMNPAQVGKGVFQKIVTELYKMRNDPNNIVKNMFEKADKVINKGEFKPKSSTIRLSSKMQGKAGMSIQDVTKGESSLINEAKKYKSAEEFVKSKTNAFHQTNENITIFDKDSPTFFNTFKRPATYGNNTVESFIDYKKPYEAKTFYWTQDEQAKKLPVLKKKGYDAVIFRNPDDNKIQSIVSISPIENVKTKSQLTEIWNKANKPTAKKYFQEGKKLKQSVLNVLSDFTDFVGGSMKGMSEKQINQMEIQARQIAKTLGMKYDVSNEALANKFGKILERHNFKR